MTPFELKSVIGYEGLYSVSDDGRVWSHEKRIQTSDGRVWVQKAKFLKTQLTQGYPSVRLYLDGVGKRWRVHRLVALAWLAHDPCRPHVNHKDSDRTNNHVTNLEWCTNQENIQHGWNVAGRTISPRQKAVFDKGHEARRFFTESQVLAIRQRVKAGAVQRHIAREFNVCPATICQMVKGRNYPKIGEKNASSI